MIEEQDHVIAIGTNQRCRTSFVTDGGIKATKSIARTTNDRANVNSFRAIPNAIQIGPKLQTAIEIASSHLYLTGVFIVPS
ncbi:MAG: hypothetical protein V1790_15205 [Planctomycetota bacterium]